MNDLETRLRTDLRALADSVTLAPTEPHRRRVWPVLLSAACVLAIVGMVAALAMRDAPKRRHNVPVVGPTVPTIPLPAGRPLPSTVLASTRLPAGWIAGIPAGENGGRYAPLPLVCVDADCSRVVGGIRRDYTQAGIGRITVSAIVDDPKAAPMPTLPPISVRGRTGSGNAQFAHWTEASGVEMRIVLDPEALGQGFDARALAAQLRAVPLAAPTFHLVATDEFAGIEAWLLHVASPKQPTTQCDVAASRYHGVVEDPPDVGVIDTLCRMQTTPMESPIAPGSYFRWHAAVSVGTTRSSVNGVRVRCAGVARLARLVPRPGWGYDFLAAIPCANGQSLAIDYRQGDGKWVNGASAGTR